MDTARKRRRPREREEAVLAALEKLLDEAQRELARERALKLAEVRKAIRRYRFTAEELRLEKASPG